MSENLALVGQWRHAKLNYVSIWMVTSQTTWCLIDKRFQPTIILIARSYFESESEMKYSWNIAALSSDFIIDMTDKTTDIYVKSNSWNSNENETYLQPLYIIDYNQLDNMITLFIFLYELNAWQEQVWHRTLQTLYGRLFWTFGNWICHTSWNPSIGSGVIAVGSWVNISCDQFKIKLLYLHVSKNTIYQSGCHHMTHYLYQNAHVTLYLSASIWEL